ncbi:hypothetical protein [Demequina sp.]|uniref:hypothetical protein n=1 Tax=Demequina sp. TaxID=2050685 RepID=UPI003A883932
MTIAHPLVATPRKPARDRNSALSPKAAIAAERDFRIGSLLRPLPRPVAAPQVQPRPIAASPATTAWHADYARLGISILAFSLRLAVLAALLVGGYLLIVKGIVPMTTSVFVDWYAGSIAPLTEMTGFVTHPGVSPAVEMGLLPGTPAALLPVG